MTTKSDGSQRDKPSEYEMFGGRPAAVNLARNLLREHAASNVTIKGIVMLARAVMAMDEELQQRVAPSAAVSIGPDETPHTEALRYLCRTCIPSSSQAMETALDECAEMEREVRLRRREAIAMTGLLEKARRERDAALVASSATGTSERPCLMPKTCEKFGCAGPCGLLDTVGPGATK